MSSFSKRYASDESATQFSILTDFLNANWIATNIAVMTPVTSRRQSLKPKG